MVYNKNETKKKGILQKMAIQYQVVTIRETDQITSTSLSTIGTDGWNLVTIRPHNGTDLGTGQTVLFQDFIFKKVV